MIANRISLRRKNLQINGSSMRYVYHLSVSLIFMLTTLPIISIKEYHRNRWLIGAPLCYYTSYVIELSKFTCPYFAMALAIDRLSSIRKSKTPKKLDLDKQTNVETIISGIWILSCILALPNLFATRHELVATIGTIFKKDIQFAIPEIFIEYGNSTKNLPAQFYLNKTIWVLENSNITEDKQQYQAHYPICHKAFGEVNNGNKKVLHLLISQYCITIIFGTCIPTVVIITCSIMMIANIKIVFIKNGNLSDKLNEKLRLINKMVCILIISFAICWLPNAISNAMVLIITMNLTGVIGEYCWWVHMHSVKAIHTITQNLLMLYTIAHPVTVAICNSDYQKSLDKNLSKMKTMLKYPVKKIKQKIIKPGNANMTEVASSRVSERVVRPESETTTVD